MLFNGAIGSYRTTSRTVLYSGSWETRFHNDLALMTATLISADL